jgi:hypothetical protein
VSTKKELQLGPFSTRVESAPVTGTVTVVPKDKPAIEAPKEKLHLVYIQGQSVSEADRDLVDLREFVERGALEGFTRQLWLGHKYQSGHDGTRERYDHLVDVCTQAGVLEAAGRTWRMAVPVDQAVDALNLGSVALG